MKSTFTLVILFKRNSEINFFPNYWIHEEIQFLKAPLQIRSSFELLINEVWASNSDHSAIHSWISMPMRVSIRLVFNNTSETWVITDRCIIVYSIPTYPLIVINFEIVFPNEHDTRCWVSASNSSRCGAPGTSTEKMICNGLSNHISGLV